MVWFLIVVLQINGGRGIDGAINEAAGPELWDELQKLNDCETGKCKVTSGYKFYLLIICLTLRGQAGGQRMKIKIGWEIVTKVVYGSVYYL